MRVTSSGCPARTMLGFDSNTGKYTSLAYLET
jgi:hypothetical protein